MVNTGREISLNESIIKKNCMLPLHRRANYATGEYNVCWRLASFTNLLIFSYDIKFKYLDS